MSSAARHLSSIIIILSLPGVLSTQGFKVAGQRGNLLKITAQRSGLDASPRYEFPAGIGGATAREGQDARRGPAGRGGLNDKAAREASRGLERGPVSRPKTLQDLLLKTVEKGPNLRDARAAPASYKAAQPTHNLKRSAGPVSFKALHGTGPADDTSAAVSGTPALPFGASGGSEVEVWRTRLRSMHTHEKDAMPNNLFAPSGRRGGCGEHASGLVWRGQGLQQRLR